MAVPYTQEEKERELARIREQFEKCSVKPFVRDIQMEELMLPARDGVRLRTVVCRPRGGGRFPTVVCRSCYPDADAAYRLTAKEYARRGFGYIYQYCRGIGDSEGAWEPNVNERDDGKDMLDWADGLDWVESLGYAGCSYLALTGWVVADILPPKVKTMYLTHYGVFRHTSAYQDGLFRHDILTSWAMWNAGRPIRAGYLDSCRFRPHEDVDEALWGGRLDWYRAWVTSPDREDAYWNTGFWGELKAIPPKVRVPLYLGEGWYDHHLGSAIETYRALSDEARAHTTFRIGPWDHNFNFALEGRTGKNADADEALRCFNWFYGILVKGEAPEGKILSYVCGDDSWHCRPAWHIPEQGGFTLHLAAGDGAGAVLRLSERPPGTAGMARFTYDPDDPAPTHGAESLMASSEHQGSLRQPEPGWREDVISFVSDALDRDLTVMGSISVRFQAASSAQDTAFAAKVMEVLPSGEAYHIRTGITTLGYRGHSGRRQAYEPGTAAEAAIDMWDIAWKLHRGSRVRQDITSSDFPQYAAHSNYPGVWARQGRARRAEQTIFFGDGAQAFVSFPVIKEDGQSD